MTADAFRRQTAALLAMLVDQINGLKQRCAGVTLIAPGRCAAVRTGSDDISIRQELAASRAINLAGLLFDQKILLKQNPEDVLDERRMLVKVSPAVTVVRKAQIPENLVKFLMIMTGNFFRPAMLLPGSNCNRRAVDRKSVV